MSQAGRTVDVRSVGRVLVRGTRRAVLTVVGFALVAVGLAGLILPILPGWILIVGGFAVLSREYSWARSGLLFASRQAARGGASLRSLAERRRVRRRPDVVVLPRAEIVIDLTRTPAPAGEADDAVSPAGAPLQDSERTG
jgi:uncharacterized membrane protein YbaN (DUF454 family)